MVKNNFCLLSLILLLCTSLHPVNHGNENELERAIKKYKDEYLASAVDWPGWKGNVNKCKSGDIPNSVRKKALLRINYFRTICGLYPVEFKEEYNRYAQQAAFIIAVDKKMSHHPDKTWKCYTEEASVGCANSSLGLVNFGYTQKDVFISAFIKDFGLNNEGVPHRRSMLNSVSRFKGYGATWYSEAIYNTVETKKEITESELPKFVAYPVEGYNEIDLVYPRWSFGIPDTHEVDFSETNVILIDQEGKKMDVDVLPYRNIYDPTIVWEFSKELKKHELLKKEITVEVKNVLVDGELRDYNYVVKFFDYPEEGE